MERRRRGRLDPDEDTLIELTAGKGDGEARYAGRGMDGSQFKRESLGLRFVKSNVSDVLEKVEAQVYYNYADHIMDNFRLRTPDPSSMMPMPMASQVDRRTSAVAWRPPGAGTTSSWSPGSTPCATSTGRAAPSTT